MSAPARTDLRDRLFDAAIVLIRDAGYDRVPVSLITHEVGVAKGTFFNYFPSKDHILAEALRRILDRAMEAVRGRSGIEAILAILTALATEFVSDRPLSEPIVLRLASLPAPLMDAGPSPIRDEERLRAWFENRLGEVLLRAVPLVELERSHVASLLTWTVRGSLEEWIRMSAGDASLEGPMSERVRSLLDAQGLPVDSP